MEQNQDPIIRKFLFVENCNERYLSPQEIRYRVPQDMNPDEVVGIITNIRGQKSEILFGLSNIDGKPYRYWETPTVKRLLHEIDLKGYDTKWSQIKQPVFRDLIVDAIIDEALYSSMIEGARTTRQKAEDMIRKGVPPKDRSEQMTYNNYKALLFIRKNLNRDVTTEFVNELHKILVDKTLDEPDIPYSGRYREDQRYVVDEKRHETVHVPPPPGKIEQLMGQLYNWINFEAADFAYLHPVVKAAMIHFYTVYIHPYVDGNGRVARSLMYYYLLKKGYNFFQFFSISKSISSKRDEYYSAIKNVEESEVDLTYFVLFSAYMVKEATETVETEWERSHVFTRIIEEQPYLNDRQKRFIKTLLKGGNAAMTIAKYMKLFDVVYETARKDLMVLAEKKLIDVSKKGRQQFFSVKSVQ